MNGAVSRKQICPHRAVLSRARRYFGPIGSASGLQTGSTTDGPVWGDLNAGNIRVSEPRSSRSHGEEGATVDTGTAGRPDRCRGALRQRTGGGEGDAIGLARGGRPITLILKPFIEALDGAVENELFPFSAGGAPAFSCACRRNALGLNDPVPARGTRCDLATLYNVSDGGLFTVCEEADHGKRGLSQTF